MKSFTVAADEKLKRIRSVLSAINANQVKERRRRRHRMMQGGDNEDKKENLMSLSFVSCFAEILSIVDDRSIVLKALDGCR